MANPIYFVDSSNNLIEMQPSNFLTEHEFQSLLADHPPLLHLAAGSAGKLLLISREFGIADSADAADRWNIDHLFVTVEAVPVLVEVKRASDGRGRREVVAQMLDYASHGTAYWSGDKIRVKFEQTAAALEQDADARLNDFLAGGEAELFWRQVEANLRSGRIRMLFVSDRIGPELKRIIEWLNEQMRLAEVLAIEVSQFVSPKGERTLVPTLIGDTEKAESAKTIVPNILAISVEQWIEEIPTFFDPAAGDKALQIISVLKPMLEPKVAYQNKGLAFYAKDATGQSRAIAVIRRETGFIELYLANFSFCPQVSDASFRQKILDTFVRHVPKFRVTPAGIDGYPNIKLANVAEPGSWISVLDIFKEIVLKFAP